MNEKSKSVGKAKKQRTGFPGIVDCAVNGEHGVKMVQGDGSRNYKRERTKKKRA